MNRILSLTMVGLALLAGGAVTAVAQAPAADEIMRRSNASKYYLGDDMRARVVMRLVSPDGRERIRDMVLARRNVQTAGEQRYFLYFNRPPDVRDMALLVWKYPNRDDDRWLYIPAFKAVRRIAASDKHTSFVGSDFTYEDVSGREPEDDTHKVLREESTAGRETYVVESVPKTPADAGFSRRLSWIDKANWLALKEEYYDGRGDLARVFTAEDVKEVDGFWTVTKRVMKNAQSGHRTEVIFSEVRYNRKLPADVFSERSLRTPPAELTR